MRAPYAILVQQKDGTKTRVRTEEILIEPRFSKGRPYVMALMDNVVTGAYRVDD